MVDRQGGGRHDVERNQLLQPTCNPCEGRPLEFSRFEKTNFDLPRLPTVIFVLHFDGSTPEFSQPAAVGVGRGPPHMRGPLRANGRMVELNRVHELVRWLGLTLVGRL